MTNQLVALLDNKEVGRVSQDRQGKFSFVYNDVWRNHPAAYPISLSMLLSGGEYGHAKIEPFLWGLLPDNQTIIEKWAQRFNASPRNAFGLIAHVGEDCAGAIQFVRPERLDAILRGVSPQVAWLNEHEVAERLRLLTKDNSAWRTLADTGQFSLAGSQPKTALLLENGRWGVPSGRIPTTHILKPPIPDLDGHVENEHFCILLAQKLGFVVPESQVMRFEDQIAIVVKRYDRIPGSKGQIRVHQEDLCQALGLPPTRKYEAEGGPGAAKIAGLLATFSISPLEDVNSFVKALGYNWLIGGTDAHAKNYSLLIAAGTDVRLAPLYDLASALAYPAFDPHRIKLAMRIGGHYRLREIGRHQWERLARELNINGEQLVTTLLEFADSLPDHVASTRDRLHAEGLAHPIINQLSDALVNRATVCSRILKIKPPRLQGA
jgi:serine/threonine-protein kinase HipA